MVAERDQPKSVSMFDTAISSHFEALVLCQSMALLSATSRLPSSVPSNVNPVTSSSTVSASPPVLLTTGSAPYRMPIIWVRPQGSKMLGTSTMSAAAKRKWDRASLYPKMSLTWSWSLKSFSARCLKSPSAWPDPRSTNCPPCFTVCQMAWRIRWIPFWGTSLVMQTTRGFLLFPLPSSEAGFSSPRPLLRYLCRKYLPDRSSLENAQGR
mmetsp:Transcript_3439/g.12509  ORF Transcript_3439/g.12509 Transcript_3439/m.12509 type:complete len:210 (-) Transcript_3439:1370-1999(-)